MTTRRDFLATLAAAMAASKLGHVRSLAAATLPDRLPRIGIQLYTVRSLASKDLEGTLAALAGIGYNEVEFAGYFGRTPDKIKATLAANNLKSPSTHLGLPATDDAWSATLDNVSAMGHQWAIVASVDEKARKALGDWPGLADRFNQLGAKAKERGLRFGYHNHNTEFAKFGNQTALDVLISNTDPKLVDFEMDIYWVVKGGGDPLDLIKRYPGRFPLMHVKDASPAPELKMVDVGSGTIDFGRIFAQAKSSGMTHTFVEHDMPADPMATATNSYRYLAKLEY